MFKNLIVFGHERTPLQALGFYIVYLVLLLVFAGLIGGIVGLFMGLFADVSHPFQTGVTLGTILAVVSCIALSLLILYEKKLLNNFLYILLVVLSGLMALFLGGLAGLIPVAFLTTRKSKLTGESVI